MTTLHNDYFVCSVCSTKSMHTIVSSTNQFGSPDLDLRPPEMARSTIAFWVQECPNCKYVSESISDPLKVDASFLSTKQYLECDGMPFGDSSLEEVAKRFFRQYLLAQEQGDDRRALSALMHAAWICDDSRNDEAASACRLKAAAKATALIEQDESDKESLHLVRVDLYRRSGRFDEAIQACSCISFSDETMEKVRLFELLRAQEEDRRCYTVAQAVTSLGE